MKASEGIIDLLNDVLTAELTAINQYFIHAKMCSNWGYERIAEKIRHESFGEMKHAEKVIERVLFLEGIPNMQRLATVRIGERVKEQFEVDLALETEHVGRLNRGIEASRSSGDEGTRLLLDEILKESEEHVDWLETQLELIGQLGEQLYLSTAV
ncbi:MAG: bacterioferritin [Actinomycetota bacterium]|jgi:bacterioferritin